VDAHAGVSDGVWTPIAPPSGRDEHTAIYDSVRDRMLVFGGFDGARRNDVWQLSLGATPQWSLLATTGTPPSRRYDHAAVYDPVRDRLLIIGGEDGNDVGDIWALSLSGTPTWSEIVPSGTALSGRKGHTAIYDAANDRVIVFGGRLDQTLHTDTWSLSLGDTSTWTELEPIPTAVGRYRHTAIYDAPRQRMIVYGGHDDVNDLGDVWELALTENGAWSEIVPTGSLPPGRFSHSATYDPVRERMVVIGGLPGDLDTRVLTLNGSPEWTRLVLPGSRYRIGHSAIYDSVRDRILAFGGMFTSSDVGVLALASATEWSTLPVPGLVVIAGLGPSSIHDPLRDRIIVFGGSEVSHTVNTTRVLSLDGTPEWSALATSGTPPEPRASHRAVYDPVGDRMIVFGGFSTSGLSVTYLNDVWSLSLSGTPTWTPLTVAGSPPAGRASFSAVYDPVHRRIVIYGGTIAPALNSDEVWVLSLDGAPSWSKLVPAGTAPLDRYDHSAIYDPVGERMIVFGGRNSINELLELSLGDVPRWSQVTPAGTAPLGFRGHGAIYDPIRHRMLVIGSDERRAGPSSIAWALDLSATPTWSQLAPSGDEPIGRMWHALEYDPKRDRALMIQGWSNGEYLRDTWALTWGGAQAPAVVCSEDLSWSGEPSLVARYTVTNPLGTERAVEWTLSGERAWPGFPLRGVASIGALGDTIEISIPVPDSASNGRNTLTLSVSYAGAAGNATSCSHVLEIVPTAVLASLVAAHAEPGRVTIEWLVGSDAAISVERHEATSAWQRVSEIVPDGRGHVTFIDDRVAAGERYGYRLTWNQGAPGREDTVVAGETWIDVPRGLDLVLSGVRPNPGAQDLAAVFVLPHAGRVAFECFDVGGRRVTPRQEFRLAGGSHVVPLDGLRRPSPGVYLVRMTFEGRSVWTRAVAMH